MTNSYRIRYRHCDHPREILINREYTQEEATQALDVLSRQIGFQRGRIMRVTEETVLEICGPTPKGSLHGTL